MACSRPDLSETGGLEKGLGIRTLREVLEAGDTALQAQLFASDHSNPMVALNSAMMTDGVVIEIADGTVLTQPLHIVHIASGGTPAAMFTRSLLRLGKDAGATLVESYIAADGAKAYQVHDSADRLDRRQCAARSRPPGRGRPRGLQHFVRHRDARRPRAPQHFRP